MKALLFYLFVAGALGVSASVALSRPDPVKAIYLYSGFLVWGFCVFSVLFSWARRRVWARRVGLAGLFFCLLHFLNFIALDKSLEMSEIFNELFRGKFIITGFVSLVLLAGAGVLSFKRTQQFFRLRRAFVYAALAMAGVHIFLGVKVAGVIEYFCLLAGFALFFTMLLKTSLSRECL